MILINSVLRIGKNYYHQVFFKEYKCIVKKKVIRYITDHLEIFSNDSDKESSDMEN